ncbi:hypothetical protein NX786_21960 [Telluria mixta]|uniref:Uncharacterized protein n=1 Tax=Telluria mixta TaxID=34071 RepID=A0ABT2C467_9BURK|nr:hypothetical protein [Telluria mixta]MCS0631997.1 hypothetical protein [Telluria mixta]WEM95324.1 hypothetical protein P0M04_28215 [Telluria mixta]
MIPFFKRAAPVHDACALGRTAVALPLSPGCAAPPGCPVVIVDADGRPRRATTPAGKKVELRPGELAWAFHPGPYTLDVVPYAQAPEIGLRTTFAIDPQDPAAAGKRFDLYLAAEADGRVDLDALGVKVESAVRSALEQGALDLPPCADIDEWNAFRQGLNRLLYLRFGLTVDDCVPVELEGVDYAAQLAARAVGTAAPAPAPVTEKVEPAMLDAKSLRRLFLELPCLMCGLRLGALPNGQDQFRQQQALLQRLDRLSVEITTMPALVLAAPGQPLVLDEQLRRMRHSRRATVALDEAWALLARLEGAQGERLAALYDEAERIVANLEADCAGRRAAKHVAEAA